MNVKQNILVMGGNGFIGSHLVDRLVADGHSVRVFDKYPERYRAPLTEVEYHYGDFGNRGLLGEALRNIDTVYHLISTSLPKTSNDDPAFDVQSNVIETIFLLEQCLAQKISKFVFVSSGGTIYGRPERLPIAEDAPTNPECSYGITKLTIEKYLALYHHLHGLDYLIVRPSNPYGSRQDPRGIQGAIAVFLGKVAGGEPIVVWGDGEVGRDYIYIDDLVEGIVRAVGTPSQSRIFNLGSGVCVSLTQLIEIIGDAIGSIVAVHHAPGRGFDVPQIRLDITRARRELGWNPETSLRDGVLSMYDFIRSAVKSS